MIQTDIFSTVDYSSASNAELLAAVSRRKVSEVSGLLDDGIDRLPRKAIGDVAYAVEGALELARRVKAAAVIREAPTQIRSAHDVAQVFMERLNGLRQEELWIMMLDTKNHIIGIERINQGNVNSSIVRPAETFRPAIVAGATMIVVAHNHPSGDPSPSADDVRVTRDLVASGKMLGIEVLDHIVVGDERQGYVSLRERRLGFDAA